MKRFSASEPMSVPRQQRAEEEDRLPHWLFGFSALGPQCSQGNSVAGLELCVTGRLTGNRGQIEDLIDWRCRVQCRWGLQGKSCRCGSCGEGRQVRSSSDSTSICAFRSQDVYRVILLFDWKN